MNFREDKRLRERLELARCMAHWAAGTATEAEREFIRQWQQETPEHTEEFGRICQRISEGIISPPDMQEQWNEFEVRVGIRKKFRIRYYWYAAVLFLPVCIALGLYFQLHIVERENVPVVADRIVPGEKNARLVLNDGQIIDLDKTAGIELLEKNGTQILLVDDQLQYRADSLSSDSVVYNTVIVPVGGEYAIVLADGTKVWLNAASRLRFPVAFTDSVRQVELEGEGYFMVSKNPEQPFVVKVAGADVRVLGTSFNVFAYNDCLITTLVEGKVALTKDAGKIVLTPDQQAQWDGYRFVVREVEARNYGLWKEGIFWFSDTELDIILEQLARWYNLNISFLQPDLKKIRFSLEMKRYDDIEAVLRKIAYTQKVKFSIEGRTVRVMK